MSQILIELAELAGGEAQLIVLVGLFAGILMATMGVVAIANRDQVGRRLARAHGDDRLDGVAVRRQADGRASSKLASFITPSDERERLAVRRRLVQAGFRGPHAVRNYYLIRTGLGLMLPMPLLIGIFAFALNAGSITVEVPLIGVSAARPSSCWPSWSRSASICRRSSCAGGSSIASGASAKASPTRST